MVRVSPCLFFGTYLMITFILNAKVLVNSSLFTSNSVSTLPMVSVDFQQCSVLPTVFVHYHWYLHYQH